MACHGRDEEKLETNFNSSKLGKIFICRAEKENSSVASYRLLTSCVWKGGMESLLTGSLHSVRKTGVQLATTCL